MSLSIEDSESKQRAIDREKMDSIQIVDAGERTDYENPRIEQLYKELEAAKDDSRTYELAYINEKDRANRVEAALETEDFIELLAKSMWDAIEQLDGAAHVEIYLLEYALRSALPTAVHNAKQQVGDSNG